MRCRDCGVLIVDAQGVNYCSECAKKRFKQPVEIDPETGEWEHSKSK